jgi:hypothetical protein
MKKRGLFGKCFLPSWKVPNRHHGALNLDVTWWTVIAKAASTNRPKLGPIEATGGCTLAEPKSAQLYWAASYDHLDLAHGGILCSWDVWTWVWLHSPLCLGPDSSSNRPRSFRFVQNGICACSFAHFWPFYVYFHKCPPANGKSPKLKECVSLKVLFLVLVFIYAMILCENW